MPSLRSCTLPSLTLTAKMATMSGCYSLTIAQRSIQYNPHQASFWTQRPRPKLFTLWPDSRFPHRQTSSGENGPVHLQLHHPERRSPTGVCPESPALLSIHTRLRVLSQIYFYYQICWWYCGSGPHFQQWWDRLLGWGRETHIMVPRQRSLSEHEQN